jgi:hypothetical protein
MYVGSFLGDPVQFPFDIVDAINQFKSSGVTNLLVDVTDNPGSCTVSTNAYKSDAGGFRWIYMSGSIPCCIHCWY